MTIEVILSAFLLMLISIGTYFVSQRARLPYTVLLVLVGSFLVPITHIPGFAFLKAFHLTPELLFYIFLPILIFEAAYNMRVRELMRNVRSVTWLSVGSLIISMFFVAFALFFAFRLIGMEVPFLATLLFGALISATDPVAVLALFKEVGVPKRLSFLFEGESLFNDGTSLAAFLIVLEIILKGFSGWETIFDGIFMFSTMVLGGIVFGLFMGFLFAKLIEKVENSEHIEITLTMLVAHLTFILSEVLSHSLTLFGHEIHLSSIIATVLASMIIGNYGRSKLSPRVEQFMERFWGYFAFVANSLVFITMGLLFADLPIDFGRFVLPIFLTVLVVILARAVSVYPVVRLLNFTRKEQFIPTTWQHLLAWGSLRGALAVIMVMLIPDSLSLPGWRYDFTVKEFVTAITIGCIYFTLFVKATSISTMINRFKLNALTSAEEAEYRQSRVFIFSYAIGKLSEFFSKGYLSASAHEKIEKWSEHRRDLEYGECEKILTGRPADFEQALRAYALGIEKHFLGLLFQYREVSEPVYKRILAKLDVQLERVEEGGVQIRSLDEEFTPDWFEQLAAFLHRIFLPKPTKQEILKERYMYYRAQEIIARKVVKELLKLKHRSKIESAAYHEVVDRVIASHQEFHNDAHMRTEAAVSEDSTYLEALNEDFGKRSLAKVMEEGLCELTRKNMLPPKLAILLEEEFSRERA